MREIKFRAWDEECKEWVLPLVCGNRITQVISFESSRHIHIMQYTGLKDSKGQEIYEGDLIRLPAGEEYEVFWQKIGTNAVGYSTSYREGEVIGDIWENPSSGEAKEYDK